MPETTLSSDSGLLELVADTVTVKVMGAPAKPITKALPSSMVTVPVIAWKPSAQSEPQAADRLVAFALMGRETGVSEP
jgi:hypothetical protein